MNDPEESPSTTASICTILVIVFTIVFLLGMIWLVSNAMAEQFNGQITNTYTPMF